MMSSLTCTGCITCQAPPGPAGGGGGGCIAQCACCSPRLKGTPHIGISPQLEVDEREFGLKSRSAGLVHVSKLVEVRQARVYILIGAGACWTCRAYTATLVNKRLENRCKALEASAITTGCVMNWGLKERHWLPVQCHWLPEQCHCMPVQCHWLPVQCHWLPVQCNNQQVCAARQMCCQRLQAAVPAETNTANHDWVTESTAYTVWSSSISCCPDRY